MPRGGMIRLSPDEYAHAYVFRFAREIQATNSDDILNPWLQTVLSFPTDFKRRDSLDSQYAEANSCRQDIMGKATLTHHTARQIVANVHGFKERKGKSMTSEEVAAFWRIAFVSLRARSSWASHVL